MHTIPWGEQMNDFAGVDPQRIRQLADRLQDLATALTKNGATIRTNFATWGGTLLDLGQIARHAAQVRQDAHDMGLRADEALNLLHQGDGILGKHGNTFCMSVDIPWDVKDINPAKEARQEAGELKSALADPHAPGARETITDVARSMAEHRNDRAYLTAFMTAGGINDTVQAANALHEEDGTHGNVVLSHESQTALARFSQATRAMSDLAIAGNYPHPAPDYLAPLTSPSDDDMWSVGMLLKYGPAGSTWNPTVLAHVSGAMLDWRAKQQAMRPQYELFPGGGAPPGYYGDGKAWFNRLGLDGATGSGPEADETVAAIRANDPVLAVLDKLGDNAQGSRDLLGQDTDASRRYAAQLLDHDWQTVSSTSTTDDSEPISRVLTLAATDRSPAFQDQSGQAAYNILAAAAQQNDAFQNRPQKQALEYVDYPQSTAVALAGIAGTWADQIGATSMVAGPNAGGYSTAEHMLVVPHADMIPAMQLFVRNDPTASALFDRSMHEQLSDAAADKDPGSELTDLGNMIGLFTKAKNGVSYSRAEQLDEAHTYNMAVLNTLTALYGGTALPENVDNKAVTKGFTYSQTLLNWYTTVKAPTTDPFSTDNADTQEEANSTSAHDVLNSYTPAIVQGLIRSGEIPVPVGRPWYDPKTRTVSPNSWNNDDFIGWINKKQNGSGHTNAAMTRFSRGFTTYEGSLDGK